MMIIKVKLSTLFDCNVFLSTFKYCTTFKTSFTSLWISFRESGDHFLLGETCGHCIMGRQVGVQSFRTLTSLLLGLVSEEFTVRWHA
jgi:hypothetical protein